ncbi:MAG: hypothetical protein JNJ40_12850 [Bacteroidia bacterium]|nr:hypothetical protein [Bacteroidia bacterium]
MTTSDKIALCSVIVAIISFILTVATILQTRKHNRKSLRPIISINPFDYSNCIKIELINEGVGPAIIKKIVVEKNEHERKSSVYNWMPSLPKGLHYSNYLTRDQNIAMIPGKIIEVICIKLDPQVDNQREFREQMRGVLRQLTVKIEYTDVYNSTFQSYNRKFDLYSRTDNG